MIPEEEISLEKLEELIERHKGSIIRTAGRISGRYVRVEKDDVFAVALEAFAEAVERYDGSRGGFLSFAVLVMESRLKSYLAREGRGLKTISLEKLQESGGDVCCSREEDCCLKDEIAEYRQELSYFGLSLKLLADTAPKHKDTRQRALHIAKKTGEDKAAVEATYRKRRLPVRMVARLSGVTEKTVKGSKNFILAAMIIFVKRYPALSSWVKVSGGME